MSKYKPGPLARLTLKFMAYSAAKAIAKDKLAKGGMTEDEINADETGDRMMKLMEPEIKSILDRIATELEGCKPIAEKAAETFLKEREARRDQIRSN